MNHAAKEPKTESHDPAISQAYAKPTVEVIKVDDTFADDFLTEECGVDVTTHVVGRFRLGEFDLKKGTHREDVEPAVGDE